jgi:hypothetical protein
MEVGLSIGEGVDQTILRLVRFLEPSTLPKFANAVPDVRECCIYTARRRLHEACI